MRYTGFHRALTFLHKEHKDAWPIHFSNLIETSRIDDLRQRYKDAGLVAPSYTAIVVKSIAIALRDVSKTYPEIHAYIKNFFGWKTIHTFDQMSAGVAISRNEDGMDLAMTATVLDPDTKSLSEMTKELRDYAVNTVKDIPHMRNCYYLFRLPRPIQWIMLLIGKTFPKSRLLYRGTFTLTSVGKFGVDIQASLPQASSLQFGFGSICDRPVVRDGQVVAARAFYLTSSFDRLLMNGRPVSELMEKIRHILQGEDAKGWELLSQMPQSQSPAATTTVTLQEPQKATA